MKTQTAFPRVSHAACIVMVLLLCAVFVFPARYLENMAESISKEGEQARLAILAGEKQSAQLHIANMLGEFEKCKGTIKLFFHHEDIDEMERSLNCAKDLAALEESDNLMCELNCILQLVEHMRTVENATFSDIF